MRRWGEKYVGKDIGAQREGMAESPFARALRIPISQLI